MQGGSITRHKLHGIMVHCVLVALLPIALPVDRATACHCHRSCCLSTRACPAPAPSLPCELLCCTRGAPSWCCPPHLLHDLPPCPCPQVLCRKLMLIDEIKSDPKKDARAYAERVAAGFRPEVPRRWPHALRSLITSCWAQEPAARPSFDTVLQVLQEVRHAGAVTAWHGRQLGLCTWPACCTPLASCFAPAVCLALRRPPAPACCRSRPLA
jgi:hypothetical protein